MTAPPTPLDRILTDAAHAHFRTQIDALCGRLTDKMQRYDRLKQQPPLSPGALPAIEWGRAAVQSELAGEIHGLRQALCLLLGYDPNTEADKEGSADEYAMEWWGMRHDHTEWDPDDE